MNGAVGGAAHCKPASHTHQLHVLAALHVHSGLHGAQYHRAVVTFIYSH